MKESDLFMTEQEHFRNRDNNLGEQVKETSRKKIKKQKKKPTQKKTAGEK